MTSTKITNSRPFGVAEQLTRTPIDAETVHAKRVILTGESATLSSKNGEHCLLNAVRLLVRFVGDLTVVVPDSLPNLRRQADALVSRIWSAGSVRVVDAISQESVATAAAILNVGCDVHSDLPWTSINSNGWIARASSGSHALPRDCSHQNPLGALMAASFGATEVFKRIFTVPETVAPPYDYFEFSLFNNSVTTPDLGPSMPEALVIGDTLLVGAGAIGNGIALLLGQLRVRGRIYIIDKQEFADENLATCILLEQEGWVGQDKATRLAQWLKENGVQQADGHRGLIADAINENRFADLRIESAILGLDKADPRCESQRLWPPLIVDGGINEIGAAVTQWRRTHLDQACLQCWFQPPQIDAKIVQSMLTGLPMDRLTTIDRPLTDDDIEAAIVEKRASLRRAQREGKMLCSIITDAQLSARLGVTVDDAFRPSVPFVATAAATLVISEWIKAQHFPELEFRSQFQLANLFVGPDLCIGVDREPSKKCTCVTQSRILQKLNGAVR